MLAPLLHQMLSLTSCQCPVGEGWVGGSEEGRRREERRNEKEGGEGGREEGKGRMEGGEGGMREVKRQGREGGKERGSTFKGSIGLKGPLKDRLQWSISPQPNTTHIRLR